MPINSRTRIALLSGLVMLATTTVVQAHPGHEAHSLGHGFLHPLAGLDHILAMVAVGLLAAQAGGRAVWLMPLAFVLMVLGGALLGFAGLPLPLVEPGIAGSVVVFGALLLFRARLPLIAGMAIVGVFAVFHGFAHAVEMTPGISAAAYGAGFIAATALLHAIGIGFGAASRRIVHVPVVRAGGGAIAVTGIVMLLAAF